MAQQRQASAASEERTVIGAGISVNGRVSGEEDLHVEGRLEGSVQLTETFYVSSAGTVVAEVRARDVVVSGVLVGNVTAEDSVTLNPGAKLVGDITAPRLIIADGAAFSGNVGMGGEAPPRRERRTVRRAAPPRASRPESVAPPRVADVQAAPAAKDEDEVTIVVRHAAVVEAEEDSGARKVAKKKTKKAPPRARVPKPGKRRVGRR
jgi:cytoskeletal protein CcmA (bactofilin family)